MFTPYLTTMTTFTIELATSLFNSNEQFPINLDDAWVWLGYSKKSNAKRFLSRFDEGMEFCSVVSKTPQGGRPSEEIHLSIDCFKMLAMLAETEVGDKARKYFIECERVTKTQTQTSDLTQAIFGALSEQVRRVSYNETQANSTIATTPQYQEKLRTKEEATVQIGLIMSNHRLKLEDDRSMQSTHCQRTIHKQQRQTQIAMEGIESVDDELLTDKELKDKQKALENNPSSKQDLLPDVKPLILAAQKTK